MPQGIALVERLSLIENLRLFAAVSGVRRAERPLRVVEALDAVGLDERGSELVFRLSGGQRRLANVAAALVHRPKVLMLDEPTAGIDAVARERLYALLRRWKQNGMAILITTHDLGEADQLADSVAVMIDGTVVAAGSYGSVVQRLFDGRFECTVHLTPMAASSTGAEQDAIACELTSLGLSQRAEQPQTWSGLVELTGSFELRLLALLARTDRAIVDYHVRRPGLDAVVAHLRDRSDTTSHLLGSTCDSRSYAP